MVKVASYSALKSYCADSLIVNPHSQCIAVLISLQIPMYNFLDSAQASGWGPMGRCEPDGHTYPEEPQGAAQNPFLQHLLDYEDTKFGPEHLNTEHSHCDGNTDGISSCVQCPRDMIAQPCRSPSPHFWNNLLQPVKLLSGLLTPGLASHCFTYFHRIM